MSSHSPARCDGPAFLQFGDLRLGSPVDGRLRLPAEKAAVRAGEQRQVFRALCAAAAGDTVDCVVVAGDLFDGPVPSADDLALVLEGFAGLAPVPVLICPGDRDAYRPDSIYNRAGLSLLSGRDWPGNVVLFAGPEYETVRPAGLDGVAFTARSHPPALNANARPLARRIDRPAGDIAVLIHHGTLHSLRNACREPTEVFTEAELLAQGFAYAAVGHSGRSYVLRGPAGEVRAADAGGVVALGRPNQSRPAALTGRITRNGVPAETVRPLRVDPRTVVEVKTDLSGAGGVDEIAGRIRAAIAAGGATPADMVYVSAVGLYAPRAEPPPASEWKDLPYFHVRVDYSAARPDYDLEALRDESRLRPTVERRFTAALAEQIDKAADDEQRELLESALYCGLEALRHGRTAYRG
jgi:hypothetical protein